MTLVCGTKICHIPTFDTQSAAAQVLFLEGTAGGRQCYLQEVWGMWCLRKGDETIKTLEAIAAGLAGICLAG